MESPFVTPGIPRPSETRRQASALARPLARRIVGTWFRNRARHKAELLGPEFDAAVEQALADLATLERRIAGELAKHGYEELLSLTNLTNLSDSPVTRALLTLLEGHVAGLPFWVRCVFGSPHAPADYTKWSKAPGLTATEAFLLSVGLNPLETFVQALATPASGPAAEDPITEALRMSLKVFARSLDPVCTHDIIDPAHILRTVTIGGFDVTADFRFMLDRMVWRSQARQQPVPARSVDDVEIEIEGTKAPTPQPAAVKDTAGPDGREFKTMARLVTTLAMEHYGYDPTARKSDVPAKISGKATLHGFQISEKTVLKYLRHGAEQISELPQPDKAPSGNKRGRKRK